MERTFVRTCSLLLSLLVIVSSGQRFDLPPSPSRSPGLQLDGDGRIYTSAGNRLYRLNSSLWLEETKILNSEAVNISLSSDGRWLVVCLTDLSCEVYNATNFSAGHVFRRENAIVSTKNTTLFAAEDSFYVGGISLDVNTGAQRQIVLSQYGFAGDRNGTISSGSYDISRGSFVRNFYGGFVRGDYAYFFVVDNNPRLVRNYRVIRVCHNSDFSALYELALDCGGALPSPDARIAGVSAVENFVGTPGTTVILTRNRPEATQEFVCLFSLEMIDNMMESKFNSCSMAGTNTNERIDLSWRESSVFCSTFMSTSEVCHFVAGSPLALDDFEVIEFVGNFKVNFGFENSNFITASIAIIVESFSFVFVAFLDPSGDSFIIGFDASAPGILLESNGFDRRPISNGPVSQLQWQSGAEVIYAITDTAVIQISVADCSSQQDCTSCLENGNPLCGWCVVENKCSKQSECQNSEDFGRWIQAAGSNTNQCPTITVSPEQYVMDSPQTITLTVSQNLSMLLDNETYRCHFAGDEATFMVEAVGSGATYMCNITGSIPTQYEGLATVLNVSLVSSLQEIPFSTNVGGLTIYGCNATSSCSQCLQTNNACGWCIYNKVCSGTADPCLSVNGTDTAYLQPNLAMGQTFADVCPLLDQPSPGVNYTQPVLVNRNIELVTRNLPPEIANFSYMCHVNGVNLDAIYNNETSLTCSVDMNTLTLPSGVIGQEPVDITIRWMGPNNLDHPIDAFTPVSVILYNCAELADSCSSCLGSEFECHWCGTPNQAGGSCAYSGPGGMCDAMLFTEGSNCANPSISDFSPKSGPPEGGTTVTIIGTDLGVAFSDFTGNSIQVGGVTCTPINDNYIPGQRIDCTTTSSGGPTGLKTILITLPNGVGTSDAQFNVVSPQITRVFPPRGPQAGGTQLTVYGSDLNIGNTEDTHIFVVDGMKCTVDLASIKADRINCTTQALSNSAPPITGPVMILIDNATISNSDVEFTYTVNPKFYSVTPTSTIIGGGIKIIFNGTNLDVVQNPMLVISDPHYLNVLNITHCMVINSTAISCVTPPLNRIQPGDANGINYTIRVDNAPGPDLSIGSLQINVVLNPENFMLVDSVYTTRDIATSSHIRLRGENLNSVSSDLYIVSVGGGSCAISFITDTEINCVPPSNPPGGNAEAIVTVSVGEYLIYILESKLVYNVDQNQPSLSTIIPAILIPLLLVIIALVALIVGLFYFYVISTKRKFEMIDKGGESKANSVAMSSLLLSSNLQIMHEELVKQVPKKFVIPSSQLRLSHNRTIGQGEFGIVYKAQLINWQGHQLPLPVAVKTLKGLFTASDVESMLAEITKMKDLHHPNVMSLIGVCLDAGPGVAIVMPFMANGSLLDYLKKEREKIYLPDTSELEDLLSVRKLLLRMCHQIAKGMEYLALNKFVHRDLAARNCMLDSSGNVRVGDLGLAEDVYTQGYFRQGKDDAVKLPFKWMAPESLRDGLFGEKSDVWSFGVTCWEVFSAGRIPYSGVDAMSMLKILESGTRLEKPDNAACAPEIYSTVVKCWALNPEDRPDFKQLEGKVRKLLNLVADYIELTMELLPKEEGEELSGYEIIENPETEEPYTYAKAETDVKPASEVNTSGYAMTDNSAYRAAGTQSSASVHAEVKMSDNGGNVAVNFDITTNTAYSSTSYN